MGVQQVGKSIGTSFANNIIAAPTELDQMHATAAEIEPSFRAEGEGGARGEGGCSTLRDIDLHVFCARRHRCSERRNIACNKHSNSTGFRVEVEGRGGQHVEGSIDISCENAIIGAASNELIQAEKTHKHVRTS